MSKPVGPAACRAGAKLRASGLGCGACAARLGRGAAWARRAAAVWGVGYGRGRGRGPGRRQRGRRPRAARGRARARAHARGVRESRGGVRATAWRRFSAGPCPRAQRAGRRPGGGPPAFRVRGGASMACPRGGRRRGAGAPSRFGGASEMTRSRARGRSRRPPRARRACAAPGSGGRVCVPRLCKCCVRGGARGGGGGKKGPRCEARFMVPSGSEAAAAAGGAPSSSVRPGGRATGAGWGGAARAGGPGAARVENSGSWDRRGARGAAPRVARCGAPLARGAAATLVRLAAFSQRDAPPTHTHALHRAGRREGAAGGRRGAAPHKACAHLEGGLIGRAQLGQSAPRAR
ncbi:MAG: hypothetical protein J3K34DRAFT_403845 [Monoraphidium minutum]|nr:MAG: hypothetical protein J3K34DRAFT_403845 [Monoraphidium minutum]